MAQVLRYAALAIILVGLGWKAYTLLTPEPEPEAPRELMVGDPESDIQQFFGTPIGVSSKGETTTYFFESAEVDAMDGTVSSIRDQRGVTGTLKIGERKVVVDGHSQIGEQ